MARSHSLCVLTVAAALCFAPAAHAGLVAYWPFDEGGGTVAMDQAPYGNSGGLTNMDPAAAWVGGNTGSPGDMALRFDGANDFVNVADRASISMTGDFTLAAWVRPESGFTSGTSRNILAKAENSSYRWRLNQGSGEQWLLIDDGSGGFQLIFSGDAPSADAWQHLAVTVDFSAGEARFYRDGLLRAALPVTEAGVRDHGNPLRIGAYNGGGQESFLGAMDDVAIWDEALDGAAIAALAAGASPMDYLGVARKGTINFIPITNDADSQISADKLYTHAIDFGTGAAAAVNGVGFLQGRTGALPYPHFDYQIAGGGRSEHGGNNNHNVSGNVVQLFRDMLYNGNNPAGNTATATLTGLIPGVTYDTRIYVRQWGPSNRQATVAFDTNGDGVPENWVPVNEDDARTVGFSDANQAYALSYTFTADSDRLDIYLNQAFFNMSWHLYGLTNEAVGYDRLAYAPLSGLVTADNRYELFLSTDDSVAGTSIFRGNDHWESAETIGLLIPTDQQFYLHVMATNTDPPGWGGFIARLTLPDNYIFLETGTNVLETSELLWLVNNTGFGDPMVPAVSLGSYGIAPWGQGCNPDFPSSANWLWLGQSVPDRVLYFSVPLTVVMIPEPATWLLVLAGAAGLARRRARKRRI